MARRSNQKLKLLYLSKILLENTDERKGMTLTEILQELEKYGVTAERKSIYDDMEALRVFGIDVCTTRDRYVRYYVSKRKFEQAELKIIFDLMLSSKLISETKVRELIKKFDTPMPNELLISDDKNYVREPVNDDTYKNLSLLCNAICTDKKVKFKCFEWNSRKQRILISEGEFFTVSPLKLFFRDGRYSVLCFNDITQSNDFYYVDRLLSVSVTNQKREGVNSELNDIQLVRKTENIRLRCDNDLAGEVFDYFGLGVTILSNREEYFEFSVKTDVSLSLMAWIFARGGKIKILGPDWVMTEYSKLLKKNVEL